MKDEQIVKFCITHKITYEQYILLHLLVGKKFNLITSYVKAFPFKNGKFLTEVDRQDLLTRRFLVPKDNGLTVGEEFLKIYCDQHRAGAEIYAMYPGFVRNLKGQTFPLITMSKVVFQVAYWSAIEGNLEEHNQIKLDIEFGKIHGLINIGIQKFLDCEIWLKIRELRVNEGSALNNLSTVNGDDNDL